MPIYTPGSAPIVCNGVRGSAVWQNTANGPVIRQRVKPNNNWLTRKSIDKSRFYSCVTTWRSMTDTRRGQWEADTVFYPLVDSCGSSYTMNGLNLFVRGSMGRLYRGTFITINRPGNTAVGTPSIQFFTINAGAVTFSVNSLPSPVPAGTSGMIYATPPLPPGISTPSEGIFQFLRTFDQGDGGAYNLQPFYSNIFPGWQLQIGFKIFVRVRLYERVHMCAQANDTQSVIIA